jgi:phosphate transport system protein
MPAHTDHQFEAELQELKDRLLAMGGRCEKMMHGAIRAFEELDEGAARDVMRADKQMNADELAIDELVVRILALRNPVGRDLRFAITATKVVTDLERIGDEAVNFAERVLELIQDGPMPGVARTLPEMARLASHMLKDALDSFVGEDAKKAMTVRVQDDPVDEHYGKILREIERYMEAEPANVRSGMRIASCAKYLERIADHATNIAEMVVFLARGEDVRHSSARNANV